LLAKNIQGGLGDDQAIQIALANSRTSAAHSSRSSACQPKKRPLELRRASGGTSNPLQRDRDCPRRTDLNREIDCANIDSQLQRRGGHQHFDFAFFQPSLGVEAQLADKLP